MFSSTASAFSVSSTGRKIGLPIELSRPEMIVIRNSSDGHTPGRSTVEPRTRRWVVPAGAPRSRKKPVASVRVDSVVPSIVTVAPGTG